jgi:hypothetical protein
VGRIHAAILRQLLAALTTAKTFERAKTEISEGVDTANYCSSFVLMEVDTLGVARSLGWKVQMRCTDGYRESTRPMRRCVYRKQLVH